jgi:hypothetical protein
MVLSFDDAEAGRWNRAGGFAAGLRFVGCGCANGVTERVATEEYGADRQAGESGGEMAGVLEPDAPLWAYVFSHQTRRPCGAGGVMDESHGSVSCSSVD